MGTYAFTYHYAQPHEYRFSLDSIQLAEFVAQQIVKNGNLSAYRVLDLCAGCGVVGFELSSHIKALKNIDFVEIQEIYTPYFKQNVQQINRADLNVNWHRVNYDELLQQQWANTYDLVLSNPPYFQTHQGVLSPSAFKNRCRFFMDSSFKNFILALANVLTSGGQAYFLLRSLSQHGGDMLQEARQFLQAMPIMIEKIAEVRGTNIIKLNKL